MKRQPAQRTLSQQRRDIDSFRLIAESVRDYAIFMLDPNGNVLTWTPAAQRIKGWKANEIVGKHFSTFYPEEDKKAGKPAMELRVATAEGRFEDEGWRVRKDGSLFWANVVITALWSEDGKTLLGFGKVTRDLTERKKNEDALKRANEELKQYASFVSHDLQEPLRKMASFAELLARRNKGRLAPESDQYIQSIIEGAQRMRTLITDVLEFSRLGRETIAPESVALGEVFAGVARDLEPALDDAGAKIKVGPLPTVKGDALMLGRLFQNLMSNAVKFRDPRRPPRIAVSAKRDGPEWIVCVQDNGIGFPNAEADTIFEPFKRLHGRGAYPGTGLGLAVCRRIAQLHGGRVWAVSRPGRGARFCVSLSG